jgi:hypothetical protein
MKKTGFLGRSVEPSIKNAWIDTGWGGIPEWVNGWWRCAEHSGTLKRFLALKDVYRSRANRVLDELPSIAIVIKSNSVTGFVMKTSKPLIWLSPLLELEPQSAVKRVVAQELAHVYLALYTEKGAPDAKLFGEIGRLRRFMQGTGFIQSSCRVGLKLQHKPKTRNPSTSTTKGLNMIFEHHFSAKHTSSWLWFEVCERNSISRSF